MTRGIQSPSSWGTASSRETTALYEHLHAGDLTAALSKSGIETAKPALPRHNLMPQPTPFIGRQEELARLDEMLNNPDTRLITIVGAGGMSKAQLFHDLVYKYLPAGISATRVEVTEHNDEHRKALWETARLVLAKLNMKTNGD